MEKMDVKQLVTLGILTGMTVLLSYIFSIQTPFVHVTFGFLPVCLAGFLYGPWKSSLVAGMADIIGSTCFATGAFFPGFTLSALLAGYIYGFFFYKKRITLWYACIPFLVVMVLVHLGLNTLWLTIYYNKAAYLIVPSRMIKNIICYPIEVGFFYLLYRQVVHFLPVHDLRDPWSFFGKRVRKNTAEGK